MTNSKALFRKLIASISINESKDETESIVYLFMEKVLGISKGDVITECKLFLDAAHSEKINEFVRRINNHEPIQYILGECEFYGRTFLVNDKVLIPRPETEELVKEVIQHSKQQTRALRILDIGTGSGCIPVTLKLEITTAEVFATDVSEGALAIARQNAQSLKAEVKFYQHDILKEEIPVDGLDIVVSNPPYVTMSEKAQMNENVLNFEPHLALFAPDDDPLLFYRTITSRAKKVLKQGGLIVFEINEQYGEDISKLLTETGFKSLEVIKDISGKRRIVKGFLSSIR